jgi:hypothetical protein
MTAHRTSKAVFEIGEANIIRPIFDTDGHDVRAFMIGAVDQDTGDTGLSHLANRYFFGVFQCRSVSITSYPKATPSGSFSLNHWSAVSGEGNT